jgi:hypothetical protein
MYVITSSEQESHTDSQFSGKREPLYPEESKDQAAALNPSAAATLPSNKYLELYRAYLRPML